MLRRLAWKFPAILSLLLLSACTTASEDDSPHTLAGGIYTDTRMAYSLEIPAGWTGFVDTTRNGTKYDLALMAPASLEGAKVLIVSLPSEGADLEDYLQAMPEAYQAQGINVLSHGAVMRGSRQVGELLFTLPDGTIKEKLVLFLKGGNTVFIYYVDSTSRFDSNAQLLGIDASMTSL